VEKHIETFKMRRGREMGNCRVAGPRGTYHIIREEGKAGQQGAVGEREVTGEQETMDGQGCSQKEQGRRQQADVKYFGWVESSDGVPRVFQGVDRKGLASTCKKLCPSHSLLP